MLGSDLRQSDNVQKPKPAAPNANLLRDSSLMAGAAIAASADHARAIVTVSSPLLSLTPVINTEQTCLALLPKLACRTSGTIQI